MVSVSNKTPTINITSPATGTKYTAPASISFSASATDIDGTISKVEYYNGLILIGTATTSPYSYTWSNVVAGTYSITAKATDNKGAVGISNAISVTVSKVPLTYTYNYDGSGNYSWDNTNSWLPKALPEVGDTGIIKSGEAQLKGITVNAEIRLESGGTIKNVSASSIAKLVMLGGTLSVYTGGTGAPLTSAITVANDSKINVGSTSAAVLTLNGTIAGAGNIDKTGVGTLLINATADAYKGNITVTGGIVKVASSNGLGLCGAIVKVGATLDISANTTCYSLVIDSLGKLALNQNITVQTAVLGQINLVAGVYNAINMPFFISGTGTLTVQNNLLTVGTPIAGSVTLTASSGIAYDWYNGSIAVDTSTTFKPSSSGNYNVKATNAVGCTVSSAAIAIQTVNVKKGWNLISFNLHPVDSSIATLCNGIDVLEIKNMDAFWHKGQNAVFNSLSHLTTGTGYFVYMNTAGMISLTGRQSTMGIGTLKTGWNLIGCPFQIPITFNTYFSTANCTLIKNFDGFWIPSGTTNSIQNLEPAKGYFVKK